MLSMDGRWMHAFEVVLSSVCILDADQGTASGEQSKYQRRS